MSDLDPSGEDPTATVEQQIVRRKRRMPLVPDPVPIDGDIGDELPCEVCDGTGKVNEIMCSACAGIGLGSFACFLCGGHDAACAFCGRGARAKDSVVPHAGHDPECADADGFYLHERCTCGQDPTTPWDVVVMDPPWYESGGGVVRRGAQRHYPLLRTAQMPDVIEASGCWQLASRALCFMWVTTSFLEDGLWLLNRLGFKRCGMFVWAKIDNLGSVDGRELFSAPQRFGMGQWSRVEHEFLLLGKHGLPSLPRPADRARTVIYAPRAAHSVKPQAAWDAIEQTSRSCFGKHYAGIEIFSRTRRPGWHAWGDEIPGRRPR